MTQHFTLHHPMVIVPIGLVAAPALAFLVAVTTSIVAMAIVIPVSQMLA